MGRGRLNGGRFNLRGQLAGLKVLYMRFEKGNKYGALTTRHGFAHKPGIYFTWKAFRTRIKYSKYHGFGHYGGKGVDYDPRWDVFENFQSDMQEFWYPKAVLHRIDSNKDYCKENCIWMERSAHASLHNNLRWRRNASQMRIIFDGPTLA